MSRERAPQTVQRAQKFYRRCLGIIMASTGIGTAICLALIFTMPNEVLGLLAGTSVLIAFAAAPYVVWGKKLQEAQKVLAVWAKIEAEHYESVMKQQLRLEMDRQVPAGVRLRQRV